MDEHELRIRAREIAIGAAATDPERHTYTQGAQMPHGGFEPHAWVIDAVARALREGNAPRKFNPDDAQSYQIMALEMVRGTLAPHYANAKELQGLKVIITEQGTQMRLPIVDFVFVEPDDTIRVYTTTGRVVRSIGSAIDGINLRNHGKAMP